MRLEHARCAVQLVFVAKERCEVRGKQGRSNLWCVRPRVLAMQLTVGEPHKPVTAR